MAHRERDVPPVGFPTEVGGGHNRLVDLTLLLAEDLLRWWSTHLPYRSRRAEITETPLP